MPWKKNIDVNKHESVSKRKTCDANQSNMVNHGYKADCFSSKKGEVKHLSTL